MGVNLGLKGAVKRGRIASARKVNMGPKISRNRDPGFRHPSKGRTEQKDSENSFQKKRSRARSGRN